MASLTRISFSFAIATSLLALGCSGDSGYDCGEGTVVLDGQCVPAASVCQPGTVLVDHACVPDGTVVCAQGTEYDAATGTCVAGGSRCGEGTVEVDGECVNFDDTLVGEVTEAAEPNDIAVEGTPATLALGAVGDAVTASGCVVPADLNGDGFADPDGDSFSVTVDAPAMLDITVDGRGGLSAGFLVSSDDDALVEDAWRRIGLNLVSDGASRQVYLPKAGTYYLTVTDGRSLLTGSPAGSEDACYFMQVSREAVPAAAPNPGGLFTDIFGAPKLIRATATEGQVLFPTVMDADPSATSALVTYLNGEYHSSVSGADEAAATLFGLAEGDELLFVLDHEMNYALEDVEYLFGTFPAPLQELPRTPGDVTIDNGEVTANLFMFNANAGEVLHVDFEAQNYFLVGVAGRDGSYVSQPCPVSIFGGGCDSTEFYLPIAADGLYYLILADLESEIGSTVTVSLDAGVMAPTEISVGSPASVDLSAGGRQFLTLDASTSSWLSFQASELTNLGAVNVSIYDLNVGGALDSERLSIFDFESEGTAAQGWVTAGDNRTYLLSLESADETPAGGESLVFTAAERDYVDLGSVSAEGPIAAMSYAFDPSSPRYFLVRATAGSTVNMTASPLGSEDARIARLDRSETVLESVDDFADASSELLAAALGTDAFAAFAITNAAADAGNIELSITAVNPPYSITPGTIAFVDVCAAGETLLTDADDSLSATTAISPMAFPFFDSMGSEVVVSSNGWMTFDGSYVGDTYYYPEAIPSEAAPNLIVAPFWRDLEGASVCIEVGSDAVTVQWEGFEWGTSVEAQFQAVLHASGTIDFVYGPNHQGSGADASIGIEDADGLVGVSHLDVVEAETSLTFEPR